MHSGVDSGFCAIKRRYEVAAETIPDGAFYEMVHIGSEYLIDCSCHKKVGNSAVASIR